MAAHQVIQEDLNSDNSAHVPGIFKMKNVWFTEELLRRWWFTWIMAPTNYRAFWKSTVYHYSLTNPHISAVVSHHFFENFRSTYSGKPALIFKFFVTPSSITRSEEYAKVDVTASSWTEPMAVSRRVGSPFITSGKVILHQNCRRIFVVTVAQCSIILRLH